MPVGVIRTSTHDGYLVCKIVLVETTRVGQTPITVHEEFLFTLRNNVFVFNVFDENAWHMGVCIRSTTFCMYNTSVAGGGRGGR